jgi:hypothetical protein
MLTKVVICGTFHRDINGLRRLMRELETANCRVLSPISIDFINTGQPVVRSHSEIGVTISELERFHLRAIHETDLIWLHAPEGHVGISGSFELGVAYTLRKPVFCLQKPKDEMLVTQIHTVSSVFEALERLNLFSADEVKEPYQRVCDHVCEVH